ncbi:GNAT family N-acetyltransferase [Thalassotalea ganghwensis]
MDISLLTDDPLAIKTIAHWYFDEWCKDSERFTFDEVISKVSASTNHNTAPLIIIAKIDGQLVGAAELKLREMDIYPEFEHWLGGVYVDKKYRGQKVASTLTQEIIALARRIGVKYLYLQTEDLIGGLYLSHGFKPIERVNYKGIDVLVMSAHIGD